MAMTSKHNQFRSGDETVRIISDIVDYVVTESGFIWIKINTVIAKSAQNVFLND